jgi:hypothetical protein
VEVSWPSGDREGRQLPCDPLPWPPTTWISSKRRSYGDFLDYGGLEDGLDGGWSLRVDDGWTHDPCDAYLVHSCEPTWINVPQRSWRSSHRSLTWLGPKWCHLGIRRRHMASADWPWWPTALLAMWDASSCLLLAIFHLFCPCNHNSPSTSGTKWNLIIFYFWLILYILALFVDGKRRC